MKFSINGKAYRTTTRTTELISGLVSGGIILAFIAYTFMNLEALSTIL